MVACGCHGLHDLARLRLRTTNTKRRSEPKLWQEPSSSRVRVEFQHEHLLIAYLRTRKWMQKRIAILDECQKLFQRTAVCGYLPPSVPDCAT
jgi:hypothetical protein